MAESLHNGLGQTPSATKLQLTSSWWARPPPLARQVALYRMAQELAQNAVKHAYALKTSLNLATVPGRGDGASKTTALTLQRRVGSGLRTTRNQVVLLGDTIDAGSSPTFGTYGRRWLPLPTSHPPEQAS